MPYVLCINSDWDNTNNPKAPKPVMFDYYLVVDEIKCPCGFCNEIHYRLHEFGLMWSYNIKHFVECGGPDEIEIKKQRDNDIKDSIEFDMWYGHPKNHWQCGFQLPKLKVNINEVDAYKKRTIKYS